MDGPTPVSQVLRSWSYRLQLAVLTAAVVFAAVFTRNPVLTALFSIPLLIRLGLLAVVWRYQGREATDRS